MGLENGASAAAIIYDGGTVATALDQRTFVQKFDRNFSSSQGLYLFASEVPSHISPFRINFDCTIVGLSFQIQRNFTLPAACDVEVYKNADITNPGTAPTEGNAIVDETFALGTDGGQATLDVDLDAGDEIAAYIRSAGQVRFPSAILHLRRR